MGAVNRRQMTALLTGGAISQIFTPYVARANTSSPVIIVMPYAGGGPIDNIIRTVAQGMSDKLQQPVLVENKPGGNGIVGAQQVVRGKKDGTVLFASATSTLSLNVMLRKNLSYGLADFSSVAMLFSGPLGFTVPGKMPVNDVKSFVAHARSREKPLFYATVGPGSVTHLYGIIMSQSMGFPVTDVAYRNNPQSVMALLTGDCDINFATPSAVLEHVKAGTLKMLAVSSPHRLTTLPDTPTFAESGFPELTASFWFGLQAPAGTPEDVIVRLNDATNSALKRPEISRLLAAEHLETESGPPALLDQQIAKDFALWEPVIKSRNIVLD